MMHAVEVDPRRFCKSGQSWEVREDVAVFPRLSLEFTQGGLFCRVVGEASDAGALSLRIEIRGDVALSCQRCLGELPYTVDIAHALHLARDETELERLDAMPGCEAILVPARLDLVALVEDEVLLSLPLAAMHAEGECAA
jgi:uncharacterized protein